MLWGPATRVVAVIDQVPREGGVPGAITVAPARKVTVLLAPAVPVKTGLTTLVMLSVLDTPLSEVAARSGTDGAAIAVSMVTDRAADAGLVLPATSFAWAVMLWTAGASVVEMIVQ